MGCLTSKTDTKELQLPDDNKQDANGKEHQEQSQKEIEQDQENQPSQNIKKAYESYSNQNNQVQNNKSAINNEGNQTNGHQQKQQSSQKYKMQVSEQKQENSIMQEKIDKNKNLGNKNAKNVANSEKNQQKASQKKNPFDGDDCNVGDFEEGVQVRRINEGGYTRALKMGQNSSINIEESHQKIINKNVQQQQNVISKNNNINNIPDSQNQQEQAQQGKSQQTHQYRPLEIKKLDQEQEQKAMEQYEKLIQNQQQKVIEQSYQIYDESTLQKMIKDSIQKLNWRQALYLNTSLLKLSLEKQQDSVSVNKLVISQIDLLLKNGQYESSFFYSQNYLDDNSEYAQYVCGNYYCLNGKYQEGFQRINQCLQLCIKNSLQIKPEYIICAGNCLIEIHDSKYINSYLDQLPLKTCKALNTPENLNVIAEQYMRINKLDQAKDILKNLINKYPDNYNGLINFGLAYIQDDVKKAKHNLKPIK